MAQRGRGARFMGGAWVFPGGVVDDGDATPDALAALDDSTTADAAWRAAAMRELVEETGVWLATAPHHLTPDERPHGPAVYAMAASDPNRRFTASSLAYFSNWVTPTVVPVRFDARFYVAAIEAAVDASADGREMDAVAWVHPQTALERSRSGDFILPLPTRKTLERFAQLGTPDAILELAGRQTSVPPIQPRLLTRPDGSLAAVLPGEPGYNELTDDPPDPAALEGAPRVTTLQGDPIPELERS